MPIDPAQAKQIANVVPDPEDDTQYADTSTRSTSAGRTPSTAVERTARRTARSTARNTSNTVTSTTAATQNLQSAATSQPPTKADLERRGFQCINDNGDLVQNAVNFRQNQPDNSVNNTPVNHETVNDFATQVGIDLPEALSTPPAPQSAQSTGKPGAYAAAPGQAPQLRDPIPKNELHKILQKQNTSNQTKTPQKNKAPNGNPINIPSGSSSDGLAVAYPLDETETPTQQAQPYKPIKPDPIDKFPEWPRLRKPKN